MSLEKNDELNNTKSVESSHTFENYMEPMEGKMRESLIYEASRMPDGSVNMGGVALRIQWENRMRNERNMNVTMFGIGKDDFDIYVPEENIDKYVRDNGAGNIRPDGKREWVLNKEKNADGSYKWIKKNYVVLSHKDRDDGHIDVFGKKKEDLTSEVVNVDGKEVCVDTMDSQIIDKITVFEDLITQENPDEASVNKYGKYAQYLLMIPIHEDEQKRLEEKGYGDWQQKLLMLATYGKYGIKRETLPEQFIAQIDSYVAEKRAENKAMENVISSVREYFNNSEYALPEEIKRFFFNYESFLNRDAVGSFDNLQKILSNKKNKEAYDIIIGRIKQSGKKNGVN